MKDNIVQHYLRTMGGVKNATLDLASALKQNITPNRFYEWQYGKRPIPPRALHHMMTVTLDDLIEGFGGSLHPEHNQDLADAILPQIPIKNKE